MQSLADFLGTNKPPDAAPAAPSARPETLTGKQFAEAVLDSFDFRQYIVNGLTLGTLPAAVICRLIDHGWGKPIERVEVNTGNQMDEMSVAQLEARALYLMRLAQHMRQQREDASDEAAEPPSDDPERVH